MGPKPPKVVNQRQAESPLSYDNNK